jgi:hypothetical protein
MIFANEREQRTALLRGSSILRPLPDESLGVGPRIYKRHLKFDSACAAAVPDAVAVFSRLRFGFGIAGFTGRRCCCWSVPFARDRNPRLQWSVSRNFAEYGVQPSNAGNITFENFLFRAFVTGDCPDVFLPPIDPQQLPGALLSRFDPGCEAEVALVNCLRALVLGP